MRKKGFGSLAKEKYLLDYTVLALEHMLLACNRDGGLMVFFMSSNYHVGIDDFRDESNFDVIARLMEIYLQLDEAHINTGTA